MDLILIAEPQDEEVYRSVTLTNNEWMILAQCAEAFSESYRTRCSQTVATYVTRGQIPEAILEAQKMNNLLQSLDHIQSKLL